MIRLQRCAECGTAQYPSREFCAACLLDRMVWDSADELPARVLARTVLHHSNQARWRARLPLTLGLVRFDAGPVAMCFLAETMAPGQAVGVHTAADGLLHAAPLNRHSRVKPYGIYTSRD
jgi:uncharacterized OB-fold protein